MPFLTAEQMGTWYFFADPLRSGEILAFASWSQEETNGAQRKRLVQGDLGTRVMSIGGIKYATTAHVPTLIQQNLTSSLLGGGWSFSGPPLIKCGFPILAQELRFATDAAYAEAEGGTDHVLSRATVQISPEGVDVTMTYLSPTPMIYQPLYDAIDAIYPYLGRVARWYDTSLFFGADSLAEYFLVEEGTIEITCDIGEVYYAGWGQTPNFVVSGYSVSGTVRAVMGDPSLVTVSTPLQPQDGMDLDGGVRESNFLRVGNTMLLLGGEVLHKSVQKSVQADQPNTVNISFETYARNTAFPAYVAAPQEPVF